MTSPKIDPTWKVALHWVDAVGNLVFLVDNSRKDAAWVYLSPAGDWTVRLVTTDDPDFGTSREFTSLAVRYIIDRAFGGKTP